MSKKQFLEFALKRKFWKKNPDNFLKELLDVRLPIHQKKIIKSIVEYNNVSIRSCNGAGKCPSFDNYVVLKDGSLFQAKDLLDKSFDILSFKDGEQVGKKAFAKDNGLKNCYKTKTSSGREIIVTENHPLFVGELTKTSRKVDGRRLTVEPKPIGWTEIQNIKAGDLVLVPTRHDCEATKFDFEDNEAKLLGYLLGDGGTTINVGFTHKFNECREEFISIIEEMGCTYRTEKSNELTITVTSKNKDPHDSNNKQNFVLNKVREWGLFGKKSKEKTMPSFVGTLPKEQIALVLNRLFACDSYVCVSKKDRYGKTDYNHYIGITLASKFLIDQIELLLLRFGISCYKRHRKAKYTGCDKEFDAWELTIKNRKDYKLFAEQIGIFGDKTEKLALGVKYSEEHTSRDKEQKWQYLNCDDSFRWEKVRECECVGEKPTVIISVEDTHTYLTTFYEHNSYILSALIIWFFYTHLPLKKSENVIVVFTAPTFDQVKENIYANIKQFIENANEKIKEKFGEEYSFVAKMSENQNLAELRFGHKNYIKGVSASGENKTVGKHANFVLLVFDEAQGISEQIYSDFRGISKSGLIVKSVMIGNTTLPDGQTGRFFESFKDDNLFYNIKISAFDTPNFLEPNLKLEDYLCEPSNPSYWRNKLDAYCEYKYPQLMADNDLSDEEKEILTKTYQMPYHICVKKKYLSDWELRVKLSLPDGKFLINPLEVWNELVECGMNPESYEFKTRVLAEFPNQNSASVFDSKLVEASMNNYNNDKFFESGIRAMGIDVAGGLGRDESSIAVVDGNKVIYLETFDLNAPDLADKVEEVYKEYLPQQIKIERDGIGKPVFDLIQNKSLPVTAVISGGGVGIENPLSFEAIEENDIKKQMFNRKRDEIWWNLRELLSPYRADGKKPVLLPMDEDLKKQLKCATYKKDSKGRIQILPKDEMKKRLKKSPDKLDSILIALAEVDELDSFDMFGFSPINISTNSEFMNGN